MAGTPKERYFSALYATERLHRLIYERLGASEKDRAMRSLLRRLAAIELHHAKLWHSIAPSAKEAGIGEHIHAALFAALRMLLGLTITVRLMERNELLLSSRLAKAYKQRNLTKKELRVLSKINASERSKESALRGRVLGRSRVLRNIRDITLGMNDGVVEVLAATAGLAVVLREPLLVVLGGLIVATAGTLSMSGGAYLSRDYERSVSGASSASTPAASAFYMGIAYIFGAMLPLLPFMAGMSGTAGIVASVISASAALSALSALISVVSGTRIGARMAKTLAISLGAAGATIAIGAFARLALHIYI